MRTEERSIVLRALGWVLICALLALTWWHKGIMAGVVLMGVMAVAFAALAAWTVVTSGREVEQ